ncbi:MAG: dTDP-glucose 4,6-dehydratase [Chlorobi bacterium]|nr:dTDP-glucose 4,6-dehydratase [Chlorobiota bacterium]
MRILVTGGCGFIGSNLICYLLEKYDDIHILNIDALTYAANPENLSSIAGDQRYEFRQIDIVDREGVRDAIRSFKPDGIYHLAAESHVDNSINEPAAFVMTNVVGMYNLLEEARQFWSLGDSSGRFLHVSTDEVYGSLDSEGVFFEESPFRPNSPYSATKASSDHLARAWYHTYGMDVVTTNCSNNFGPRQHREKLIPTVIKSALAHRPIPVYGDGKNVRDWIYVEDHCTALDVVFLKGRSGETYLIGTRNEWPNIDLVTLICRMLDEQRGDGPEGGYESLITFVTDRPGHDQRYAVDPSKIERELGWNAERSFEDAMRETVRWYSERVETSEIRRENSGRREEG